MFRLLTHIAGFASESPSVAGAWRGSTPHMPCLTSACSTASTNSPSITAPFSSRACGRHVEQSAAATGGIGGIYGMQKRQPSYSCIFCVYVRMLFSVPRLPPLRSAFQRSEGSVEEQDGDRWRRGCHEAHLVTGSIFFSMWTDDETQCDFKIVCVCKDVLF